MDQSILLGAVAYDSRVVPIWEGMRDYFREAGVPIDYVLFSNYDRQVQALLAGSIDIAWNTNLAWAKVHRRTNGACRALAMRDVDVQFTTMVVARADSGIASLADIRGKRLALGSADSAEIEIAVDKTFVPANLPGGTSKDPRELGIRVFHAFVEPAK